MNSSVSLLLLGLCVAVAIVSVNATIAVNVTSVIVLGNQTNNLPVNWTLQRDGGAVGSLGGKIVWYFSDTGYYYNGAMKGFYDNTVSIGNVTQPLNVSTPERYGIPYTATESAYNTQYKNSPRIVIWPTSGVVEVSPGFGVIFVKKGYYGSATKTNQTTNETYTVPTPDAGMVLSTVVIGADGYPVATRVSDQPFFPNTGPNYGDLASAKDSIYIYLFSIDNQGGNNYNVFVARALLANATVLSAYQYYDASSKSYGAVSPMVNETTKAVFTQYLGLNANIYYSTYHGMWIMWYGTGGGHSVFYSSAPAPEGPWAKGIKVYTSPLPIPLNYTYAVTGNNLYDATGKSAYIQFTWPTYGVYINWVVQAIFA